MFIFVIRLHRPSKKLPESSISAEHYRTKSVRWRKGIKHFGVTLSKNKNISIFLFHQCRLNSHIEMLVADKLDTRDVWLVSFDELPLFVPARPSVNDRINDRLWLCWTFAHKSFDELCGALARNVAREERLVHGAEDAVEEVLWSQLCNNYRRRQTNDEVRFPLDNEGWLCERVLHFRFPKDFLY